MSNKRKHSQADPKPTSNDRHHKVRIRESKSSAAPSSEKKIIESERVQKKIHHPDAESKKSAKRRASNKEEALERKGEARNKDSHTISTTKSKDDYTSNWQVSEPVGGQMLDLDPIISPDEEYILIPYATSVAVYFTSTSLLLRRIKKDKAGIITGIALNPQNSDYLYITTRSGAMETWDWKSGTPLNVWEQPIETLFATTTQSPEQNDLLYTIEHKKEGAWSLSAHRLRRGLPAQLKELFTGQDRLTGLKVLEGGRIVVVTAGKDLMVGKTKSATPEDLHELLYDWVVITCSDWIASFDVRCRRSSKNSSLPFVDVAIGDNRGSIFVYDNLLDNLSRRKPGQTFVSSRQLHWHRNSVLALKWSLDGNYLISGGRETVLVVWQLETGQKQHLPHLGAPIESILVSPKGASYAIRLADNSMTVLDTTELHPTFHVAGSHVSQPLNVRRLPFIPSVDMPSKSNESLPSLQYPACITSVGKDTILLAVPHAKTATSYQGSLGASSLQTCDLSTGLQIARQAIARNKTTYLNMGPDSNTIQDPNVKFMQAGSDGQWLATIDEWLPPTHDFGAGSYDDERMQAKRKARLEVFLKFWAWNEVEQVWELSSRIDNPHSSESRASPSNQILDLATDPSGVGFATLDDEGAVKTWQTFRRKRNGMNVKGREGKALTSWKCKQMVSLGEAAVEYHMGKLAYSSDGSTLAATLNSTTSPCIYLIDTTTGKIREVQNNLSTGKISGLGIVGRYLVVLSQRLMIKDLINMTVAFDIQLNVPQSLLQPVESTSDPYAKSGTPLLSVSHQHSSFAFSIPDARKPGKPRSILTIFDANTLLPLSVNMIGSSVSSILPARARRGWYLLNSFAEFITVSPQPRPVSGPLATAPLKAGPGVSKRIGGLDQLFGDGRATSEQFIRPDGSKRGGLNSAQDVEGERELDSRVVRREDLAEIFEAGGNGSALALPPIQELFAQVVILYHGQKDGNT